MNSEEYIKIFKDSGALLDGHFILTSGRHSNSYFQCAKLLQYPKYLELISKNIADHFKENVFKSYLFLLNIQAVTTKIYCK